MQIPKQSTQNLWPNNTLHEPRDRSYPIAAILGLSSILLLLLQHNIIKCFHGSTILMSGGLKWWTSSAMPNECEAFSRLFALRILYQFLRWTLWRPKSGESAGARQHLRPEFRSAVPSALKVELAVSLLVTRVLHMLWTYEYGVFKKCTVLLSTNLQVKAEPSRNLE